MDISHQPLTRPAPGASWQRARRYVRAAGRGLPYCAALLPVTLGALSLAASGKARSAMPWWRWLRTRVLAKPPVRPTRPPDGSRLVGHALLSLPLGTAACVPLGIEAVFVLRGVLYGLVDQGPYTDSWGGPTMAGAWLVHFLVGVPLAIVGLLALTGMAAVHERLTAALDGGNRARWLIPATLSIALAGTVILVSWVRQLPS